MNKKYTAIYYKSWQAGSHRHVIASMRRIEQRDEESVLDMLMREELDDVVYLFHGHPLLQGGDEFEQEIENE